MFGWMVDTMGPLAAGVLVLGVAPAVVMIVAMTTVTRAVDWWVGRGTALPDESKPTLEAVGR